MLSNTTKYIIALSATIVLLVVLFTIKLTPPNTTKAGGRGNAEEQSSNNEVAFNEDKYIETATKELAANEQEQVSEMVKSKNWSLLASFWSEQNKQGVVAIYTDKLLKDGKTTTKAAAEKYAEAYRNEQDSIGYGYFAQKTIELYSQAVKANESDIEAKTGLGVAYVETSQNPMQGIQLLLDVVKKDPENIAANMNLGIFSIRSGQYDKAIGRFTTVVKTAPGADAYAYLAEAYEKTGDKAAAITALQKAKKYVIDPEIMKQIDNYIAKLK